MIQELVHRDGLQTALAGRDDVLLEPVLALLVKYVNDPRFGELVCDVGNLVIGAPELPAKADEYLPFLQRCILPSWDNLH